jgi:nucleoside-diphosphate-sugar epimerase
MIIALTGASGFLGAAIAHRLAIAGHRVVALVRPTSSQSHIQTSVDRFVIGDHADPDCWEELLKNVDALVHNSFDWEALKSGDLRQHLHSNLDSSLLLLDAAHRFEVRRVVYMSSVAVHHEISDRWNGVVDEDHPLRPGGLYGACKAAVEAHLWAAHHSRGMHTVSIRPSAVYGVEPVRLAKSHGYKQIQRLLAGKNITPKDFPGGGKWIHVEDVAEATLQAIERDEANGKAFHLADCYAKFTQLGQYAAEAMGLPASRVELDTSPPARNQFDKTAVQQILGIPIDRGHAGLKEHLSQLVDAV